MKCRYCRGLMSSYIEDALPPQTTEAFEEHLSGCPQCADLLPSVQKVVRMLSQLPSIVPSPTFGVILRGRLLMELNRRRRPSGWRVPQVSRRVLVFVGAVAIAILALFISSPERSDHTSPTLNVAQSDSSNIRDHYYVLGQFSSEDLRRSHSSSQISLDRTPVQSDSLAIPRRLQQRRSSRVLYVSF